MRRVGSPPDVPVLVFDGDCGFCRFWIERWRHYTGKRVEYMPAQSPDIPRRFPDIPRERFARAVQLIEVGGRLSEGAEAVFRLSALGGRPAALWAYEHVWGVGAVTESLYRLIANHRPFSATMTTLLWGRTAAPSTYARTRWLFLRLLGIVYLIAFWSLGVQILGLVGEHGILPAARYLTEARELPGLSRLWLLPTLAWVNPSDGMLQALCIGGGAFALLLSAGILPWVMLPLLWLTYLSLSVVSRGFLSYQWDTLLLETGFLAIFLAPLTRHDRWRHAVDPPRVMVWLMLWLLFRLTVGSGVVKLTSGDPTWHDLTALTFHFETQPIPNPIAWYAHQLPLWLLKGSTLMVLAIELCVPFLIIAPRRLRALAFVALVGLQVVIALTGNYAFFNLLTAALCVFLLDDAALWRWGNVQDGRAKTGRLHRALLVVVVITTVPISVRAFAAAFRVEPPGAFLFDPIARAVAPFRSINSYGLFATMTTTRPEIILEGSNDATTWLEYEFKYKPGDVRRRPPWVAPHQPRIDWEIWFAAFGVFHEEEWFQALCRRLLDADGPVRGLLERDPFEGRAPRYLRAALFHYRFADAEAHRRDGVWWTRERLGEYSPILSLRTTPQ